MKNAKIASWPRVCIRWRVPAEVHIVSIPKRLSSHTESHVCIVSGSRKVRSPQKHANQWIPAVIAINIVNSIIVPLYHPTLVCQRLKIRDARTIRSIFNSRARRTILRIYISEQLMRQTGLITAPIHKPSSAGLGPQRLSFPAWHTSFDQTER